MNSLPPRSRTHASSSTIFSMAPTFKPATTFCVSWGYDWVKLMRGGIKHGRREGKRRKNRGWTWIHTDSKRNHDLSVFTCVHPWSGKNPVQLLQPLVRANLIEALLHFP